MTVAVGDVRHSVHPAPVSVHLGLDVSKLLRSNDVLEFLRGFVSAVNPSSSVGLHIQALWGQSNK